MRRKTIAIALSAALLAAGCAYYTRVEPGRQTAGGRYSVHTDIPWSARSPGGAEFWTVDGPALQAIFFFAPVSGGEPLFGVQARKEKLPLFRPDMAPSEIMELVSATMMTLAEVWPHAGPFVGTGVKTTGLEPFTLGTTPGFRFEMGYLSVAGLEYQALVVGAVRDGKLHLIAYTGTREHYFPKFKRKVEHMLASIKMP